MEGDILDIIAAVLGIGGLGFGLFQYYKAQQWKKSEFAASLIQQLSTNPDLALCCMFLDWRTRSIAVPEKYRVLTEADQFKHTWGDLQKALRPESQDAVFQFPQVLYRDAFDQFFSYLDRIDHYLNIGLFDVRDVERLRYWIEEHRSPRCLGAEGGSAPPNPFLSFIESYYYSVKELMLKFAVDARGKRRT